MQPGHIDSGSGAKSQEQCELFTVR